MFQMTARQCPERAWSSCSELECYASKSYGDETITVQLEIRLHFIPRDLTSAMSPLIEAALMG
jgi:hypothetical protein